MKVIIPIKMIILTLWWLSIVERWWSLLRALLNFHVRYNGVLIDFFFFMVILWPLTLWHRSAMDIELTTKRIRLVLTSHCFLNHDPIILIAWCFEFLCLLYMVWKEMKIWWVPSVYVMGWDPQNGELLYKIM